MISKENNTRGGDIERVEKELNDAATKIQRWFLKIIWNPYTKIGKRFHDNNYDKIFKN